MGKLGKLIGIVAGVVGASVVTKKIIEKTSKKKQTKINYENKLIDNSNAIGNDYIDCPHCGANLEQQKGFNENLNAFICKACGQAVINPNCDDDMVLLCDQCNSILNNQNGWENNNGNTFICRHCNFENDISSKDDNYNEEENYENLSEYDFDNLINIVDDWDNELQDLESSFDNAKEAIEEKISYFSSINVDSNKENIETKIEELKEILSDFFDNDEKTEENYLKIKEIIHDVSRDFNSSYIKYNIETAISSLNNLLEENKSNIYWADENSTLDKEEYTCYKCWQSFKSSMYSTICPECAEKNNEDITDFISQLQEYADFVENLDSAISDCLQEV